MAEVARAEEHLKMARRTAKKAYKKAGLETGDMFDGPFVLREVAERWRTEARAEAIKTLLAPDPPKYESSEVAQARGWAALALREEEESRLVPREPQDLEAREKPSARGSKRPPPREARRMIIEVANRKGVVRPPRSSK